MCDITYYLNIFLSKIKSSEVSALIAKSVKKYTKKADIINNNTLILLK